MISSAPSERTPLLGDALSTNSDDERARLRGVPDFVETITVVAPVISFSGVTEEVVEAPVNPGGLLLNQPAPFINYDSELLESTRGSAASGSESETSKSEGVERTLGWFQLMILCFLWTSASPFGIEPAVGAGGPLLTLLAVPIIGVFWGVPQALMSAELSLMMASNGGNIMWVQRALGPFCAWLNGYALMMMMMISNAVMLRLFVSYIPVTFSLGEEVAIMFGVSFFSMFVNFASHRIAGFINLSLLVITYIPFLALPIVAYFLRKLVDFRWSMLLFVPPMHDVNWSLLLSTVVWCFGGFDSIGATAGEVKGGKRSFLAGLFGVFPLAILNYCYPTVAAYAVDPNYKDWKEAHFTVVGERVSDWMGYWIIVSACLSMCSQYIAALLPISRLVWATANERGRRQLLPRFLAFSVRTDSGDVRPVVAIVFCALLPPLIACMPGYEILIESYMLVRLVNLLFEFAALVALRIRKPRKPRPFRIAGGYAGVALACIPTVAMTVVVCYYSTWEAAVGAGSFMVLVALLYPLRRLFSAYHIHCWKAKQMTRTVSTPAMPSMRRFRANTAN